MGMIGEYLRVTAAELDRMSQDRVWTWYFVAAVQDAEGEARPAPAQARHFSTYENWDLLRFLLTRAEFPVDVIHGEEPFAEEEDWGYGPPRCLRPERVRFAAETLRNTGYSHLIGGVEPAELTEAEVYPLGWGIPGALERGRYPYERLTQFFEAAAKADDWILVWLD
ncbi:DUF1877 family protein [Streptomyces sp. NPDC000983]|uniref:DUF1877 family protein n=1 Tax=Streptomyces sp. NPDC000983 TaxID=3154373 RepID=UPI0033239B0B